MRGRSTVRWQQRYRPSRNLKESKLDTLETIRGLAARQFGLEPMAIEPDAPVSDYGIDSLGLIEFMFVLEDAFHVQIGREAGPVPKTLRELAGMLDARRQSANHRQLQTGLG